MAKITFTNNNVSLHIPQKLKLKTFLSSIFQEESISAESVSYIFCQDDYLLRLNQQYLNHDTYTDILTFILSEEIQPLISEIYISVDRIKENAALNNTTTLNEAYRVMIHGILHLCGFQDDTTERKKEMTAREDYYLEKMMR